MNFAQTLWMVLSDLWSDRNRTVLSLLTITFMVIGYMILAGFAESIRLISAQSTTRSDMIIVERGVLDPMNSQIEQSMVDEIRALVEGEGVKISPCQFRHMRIESQLVQFRACPLEDWQGIHHLQLTQGTWPARGEVTITEGASRATGWQVGDHLKIYGATFNISGVVRASGTTFLTVWMSLEESERLFEVKDRYQIVMIQTTQKTDSEQLRSAIETLPSLAGRYDVMFLDALINRYTEVVRGLVGASRTIALAAITLIVLGSYQATRLSLEERNRTVAILRVAGFSEGQLHGLLQLRSLCLLSLAFLIGTVLSTGLLGWANRATPLQMQSVQLEVRLTMPIFLWGYPLSLVCAALGTWISTRIMLKQTLNKALR